MDEFYVFLFVCLIGQMMVGTVHAEMALWVVFVRGHHVTLIPVTMVLPVCFILMMDCIFACVLMEDMVLIAQKVITLIIFMFYTYAQCDQKYH